MSFTYAVAGWLGYLQINNGNGSNGLRFTNENIEIPQAVQKKTGVHAGQRNSGLYEWKVIRPSGTFAFPLITNTAVGATGQVPVGATIPAIDPVTKDVLARAIRPTTMDAYPPTNPPTLGDTVTDTLKVFRGDMVKVLTNPWINTLELSGSADSEINCTIGVKATSGSYAAPPGTNPSTGFGIARSIHFNELIWGNLGSNFKLAMTGGNSTNDGKLHPRQFSFSVNNNLQDDDSYNPDDALSLLGFTFGEQDVQCAFTFVGGYLPLNTDQNIVTSSVSVGGLYTISNGIWTARSLPVPAPTDLAVTTLTLTGLTTGFSAVGLDTALS